MTAPTERGVLADSYYVRDCYTLGVGGGEDAAIIELHDGTAIVIAFDVVALYPSVEAYLEGHPPFTPNANGFFCIATPEPGATS